MTNDSGFNADFWVAVAAAAPVIALSCIVGFKDPIILMANKIAKTARSGSGITAWHLALASYVSNSINIYIQGAVFIISLLSLAGKSPDAPSWLMIALEGFGLYLLSASNIAAAASERFIKGSEHSPTPEPG
jgi:hypothetical protein